MPYYAVSGADPRGRHQCLFVDASTTGEAAGKLRDRGWTDLVVHTDDVVAAMQKTVPALPAATYVLLQRGGSGNYLRHVAVLYQKMAVPLFLCLVFFLWSYQNGWVAWEFLLIALFPAVLPAIVMLLAPAVWVTRRLHRALRYEVYGRWEEMLRIVSTIGKPLPTVQRHYLRAVALSALGRLDEAIHELEPIRQSDAPAWLYHHWLAELYYRAKQPARMKEHEQRARELSPGNATVLLTSGVRRLIVDRDPHQAAAFLAEARQSVIPETAAPFATLLDGWIALDRGRLDDAERLLLRAEADVAQFRGLVSYQWPLALIRGCLALTWARRGELDKATRAFRRARPILEGRAFHVLLDPCRKEIGVI